MADSSRPPAGTTPPRKPAGTPPTTTAAGDDDAQRLAAYEARIAVLEQELAEARAAATLAGRATGGPGSSAGRTGATAGSAPRAPRSGRWRPWVVAVLLALAVPLAVSTVVARWAHNEVGNTDRYVATVAPLAANPAVQQEAVDKITTAIFTRFDVQAVTQEAIDALAGQGLPPRAVDTLNSLTAPLVTGIQSFVHDQVEKLITSQQFQDAWVTANEQAHAQLVAVLTGEGSDTVTVSGRTVSVNLAALINTVKAELINRGFTLAERIPAVNASFTILESDQLSRAQAVFSLLDTLATLLPFLTLLVLGIAVFLARDRRKALIAAGLTVAGSMLLLGTVLNLVRPLYLDGVPPDVLSAPAAAAIYDTVLHFLRLALRLVLAAALLVVLAAWFVGPSRSAQGLRGLFVRLGRGLGSLGSRAGTSATSGVQTGAAGAFAREHLVALRTGVVGVALLLFAVADAPGLGYAVTLVALAALGLLVVEFLARTAPVATATEVEADAGSGAAPAPEVVVASTEPVRTIELDTAAAAEAAEAPEPARPGTSGG